MADRNRVIFKFGNYQIPNRFIEWDSYTIKPNQRQDLDSYTDANGLTHRNALSHTKSDVEFKIRKLLEKDARSIINGITSNYINSKERDANCEYYDPESGTNKTGHFYLDPSQQFKISGIDAEGNLIYDAINFRFVEY